MHGAGKRVAMVSAFLTVATTRIAWSDSDNEPSTNDPAKAASAFTIVPFRKP